MARPLTQALVEQQIALMRGTFRIDDICKEMDIGTPEGRAHLRVVIQRLEAKHIVKFLANGSYRIVNGAKQALDWQSADLSKTLELWWPFEIHEYAVLYPKSIVVVAGAKNAGKTAFLYNFIVNNMYRAQETGLEQYHISLFNSETGAEQMKQRFANWDIPMPAPFQVFERFDQFSDVIDPNAISVIDYIQPEAETYLVGTEIDNIFRRLETGMAIIAIQKPPPTVTYVKGTKKVVDRDLGYGGGYSAFRSSLYVSLSNQRCKLVYVKTPRDPRVNPTNKQWTYRVDEDGVSFKDIQESFEAPDLTVGR